MENKETSIHGQDRVSVDLKAQKDISQVDEGLQTLNVAEERNLHLDAATSKRLRRRADIVIMPLLCLIFSIQFLDRLTLSYATALGIIKDLKLKGQDYSWISSVFFFGFLGMEFLTGRALQRLPIGKYLGTCTVLSGVVCCCLTAARGYGDAIAIRFILGMLQAAISPALILIVSQWYTTSEQSSRTAVWVSSSGFAQIFGGLVAYAIAEGTLQHRYSLSGWKVVFLIYGCITIFFGALGLIFVPDSQLNAWWLSADDRVLAVQRVSVNQQGIGNRTFKWYQFREALMDPTTWALTFFALAANVAAGGIINFFSQLIISFGYTQQQSLLYTCPAGAVNIVTILSWGFLSRRTGHRLLWSTLAMAIATLGAILMVALPLKMRVGRLVGFYLTASIPAGEAAVISLISSNVAGYTKKTTVSALFYVGFCVGNIIGPQVFRAHDAPRYVSAEIVILVVLAACMVDGILLLSYLAWQNRQKERKRQVDGYVKMEGIEFWDLTDKENPEYVYAL